jgi:hypothetical protein
VIESDGSQHVVVCDVTWLDAAKKQLLETRFVAVGVVVAICVAESESCFDFYVILCMYVYMMKGNETT